MRHVKRSALVAQPPGRVYALINDIEGYPGFLPWCTAARVVERTPTQIVATVAVRRGPMKAEFTTRNELEPESRIRMQLVRGPFRMLEGEWLLTPVAAGGAGLEPLRTGASLPGVAAAPGVATAVTRAAGAGAAASTGAAAGTRIDLSLRFAFASALGAMAFERLFEETASQLVDAFVARARELGPPPGAGA